MSGTGVQVTRSHGDERIKMLPAATPVAAARAASLESAAADADTLDKENIVHG